MIFFRIVRLLLSVGFWLCLFPFINDASRIAEAGMFAAIFLYLTTLDPEYTNER